MLIVIGMATIFGAIKGFAWQVASLASILVSYAVSYRFRFEVAEMIQAKPPWNQFLAMLILYVGTSFVIWVGFRLLSGMIDRVRLKEFDRHLGAAFGLAKGLIFCLLITMFAMSLLGPNQQAAICQSRSGYYIASALDRGAGILPKEIHDVVGPYLANLDDKLKNGQQGASNQVATGGENLWPSADAWTNAVNGIPAIPQELQNMLPGLPSAGQPGIFPSEGLPNFSPSSLDPGSLDASGLFPPAANLGPTHLGPNTMPNGNQPYPMETPAEPYTAAQGPTVFPPLGTGGSNLRPAGTSSYGQQAQQPGYGFPR
jgi:membrane protein required for colicin V production